MAEKCTESVRSGKEIPTAGRPQLEAVDTREIELSPDAANLSEELSALISAHRRAETSEVNARHNLPMSIKSLEMLEAELTNQLILPSKGENIPTLSQAAAFEVNLLQWRARRLGMRNRAIDFQINLPHYVGYLANELLHLMKEFRTSPASLLRGNLSSKRISWRAIFPSEEIVRDTLVYLDRFARYLSSAEPEESNRYQRGLNLLLRVISDNEADVSVEKQSDLPPLVTLPVPMREYLTRLKDTQSV